MTEGLQVSPEYETEVENMLSMLFAAHKSEQLKALHVKLAQSRSFMQYPEGSASRINALYAWKESLDAKLEQIIEDILEVRKNSGVII